MTESDIDRAIKETVSQVKHRGFTLYVPTPAQLRSRLMASTLASLKQLQQIQG